MLNFTLKANNINNFGITLFFSFAFNTVNILLKYIDVHFGLHFKIKTYLVAGI